jgi:hypothetical protein
LLQSWGISITPPSEQRPLGVHIATPFMEKYGRVWAYPWPFFITPISHLAQNSCTPFFAAYVYRTVTKGLLFLTYILHVNRLLLPCFAHAYICMHMCM